MRGILVHRPDGAAARGFEDAAMCRSVRRVIKCGGLARSFFLYRDHLITQAKVQSEVRANSPIILQVNPKQRLAVASATERFSYSSVEFRRLVRQEAL